MATHIEVVPRRFSKVQRAYETLSIAAWKIKCLSESELFRVAKAINPDLSDFEPQLHIFDCHTWRDDGLQQMVTFASGVRSELYRMRTALLFFRTEVNQTGSNLISHDVRLVFSLPHSKTDSCSIWLDCETGLPWVPMARRRVRVDFPAEKRAALEARDAEVYRKASAELQAMKRKVAA